MKRLALLVCTGVLVVLLPLAAAAEDFSRYKLVKDYDRYFSKYTKRFFGPAFDWKYFKAQAVAESRLDPEAESHVGARGLMQIMPETYDEIMQRNNYIQGGPHHPRWNIAAGIYYDKDLWSLWKAERPFTDRLMFTFGSFNAGKGNLLKAQKVAEKQGLNPNLWLSMEKALPRVTGKHSRETISYVRKIFHIKQEID